jgi:RNA polymerase sigma-70 factor (sigma-E family)
MAGMGRPERDRGDPADLADLFSEQYAPMVRLAFLMTGSNEVAEDVVQDAFSRLHVKWDRTENPGGYLRVSVLNGCRSWHRKRARERDRRHLVAVDDTVSPEARELLDALRVLSHEQRAAVVLRYYEDRAIDEIAEALGARPGTVKSHLHRGLARLREVLEP